MKYLKIRPKSKSNPADHTCLGIVPTKGQNEQWCNGELRTENNAIFEVRKISQKIEANSLIQAIRCPVVDLSM